MGKVRESYHSQAKWSNVCLKFAGLSTAGILYVSIQSFVLKRWASGLSPGRPLKIGGGIFTLGGGGGALAPGPGSPAAVACVAATIGANKSTPSGSGSGGPAGPAGPGGGQGGGAPGPPCPAGGGVAIRKTQLG